MSCNHLVCYCTLLHDSWNVHKLSQIILKTCITLMEYCGQQTLVHKQIFWYHIINLETYFQPSWDYWNDCNLVNVHKLCGNLLSTATRLLVKLSCQNESMTMAIKCLVFLLYNTIRVWYCRTCYNLCPCSRIISVTYFVSV